MRRLSRFSRLLNALFALWFAMVLGDPGVLHSCPMHGGHGAAHSTAAASVAGGHGEHAVHTTAAEAGSSEAGHHGSAPAPCSCVGHCCAAPAAAPVSAASTLVVPETVARVRRPLAAPASRAPASPDLRLPFANGPPTA